MRIISALLLAGAVSAQAQSGDAILDLLVKKGVINQREANEVREQLDTQAAQTAELYNKTKVSSWLDSLKWSGDFRLRTEFFDNGDQRDDKLRPNGRDNVDRWRFRYRLRLQLDATYQEWAKVGVRLASGAADDPVSTNQSFDKTFQKKPIFVDAAFVTVSPPGWDWLKVTGGKMDIPIWQPRFNSPMVYDFDVTPEGVAEQISRSFGDKEQYRLFGNFGQFAVKEISGAARDPALYDFQGGAEVKFGADPKNPRLRLTVAGGYQFTGNLATKQPNKDSKVGDSPNRGNYVFTSGSTTNFYDEFAITYVRGEAALLLSERPFLGTPAVLTLSGEWLENCGNRYADLDPRATDGWTIQAAFGDAKKKGQWQVAYQYKYLEADAVWDAITDSDWGTGGTDRKGHVVKATYNLQDWWQLGFTAFITEKISNRSNANTHFTVGSVNGEDNGLLRIQVDSVFKF